MSPLHNQAIGRIGEQIAFNHFRSSGYTIMSRNFFCRWGEIDLIVAKHDKITFVEIKTRKSTQKGTPEEAFTLRKSAHLKRPIQYFIKTHDLTNHKFSIDLFAILLNSDDSMKSFKHYENVATI